MTELSYRLSAVENILRNFILRLNILTLSSEYGHEVHQFLCLVLENHRDVYLDVPELCQTSNNVQTIILCTALMKTAMIFSLSRKQGK
jgi:ribosome biogenesis protein Nip4